MRSLLIVTPPDTMQNGHQVNRPAPFHPPDVLLSGMGFSIFTVWEKEQAKKFIHNLDGAVLNLDLGEMEEWTAHLLRLRKLPIIWWCDGETAGQSGSICKIRADVDGMLCPGMSEFEVHWAITLSFKQFYDRSVLRKEREQLLLKLEERKWIDKAKGILCQLKHISEPEAYEYLRREAMNERKRMADVAASIVKVYQLLQESKKTT